LCAITEFASRRGDCGGSPHGVEPLSRHFFVTPKKSWGEKESRENWEKILTGIPN